MKKLYMLMVGLMIAMAANAVDYYLVGAFNGWNNPGSQKFTNNGDGTYTLTYKGNLSGAFKITDGSWTDANCYGSNGSGIVLGETYKPSHPATAGDGGNMSFADGAADDPTFLLDTNNGTLLVTGATAEVITTYVIHGSFVSGSWADLTLTEENGLWVAKDVVSIGGEFGIKKNLNGQQESWFSAPSGQENVGVGSTITCSTSGSNFKIGAGVFNFSFNPSNSQLIITEGQGEVTFPANLFVIGSLPNGEWKTNVTSALTTDNQDKGLYSGKVTLAGAMGSTDAYFSLCTATASTDSDWAGIGTRYGADDKDKAVTFDVPMTITYTADNAWKLDAGTYNLSVDLDKMQITVTKTDDIPEPEYPENLYIAGDFNNWKPEDGVSLNNDGDNLFSLEGVNLSAAAGSEYSYVSFFTQKVSFEGGANNYRYGATETNNDDNDAYLLTLDNNIADVEFEKGSNSWGLPYGLYNITVDFNDNIIEFERVGDYDWTKWVVDLKFAGDEGWTYSEFANADGIATFEDLDINGKTFELQTWNDYYNTWPNHTDAALKLNTWTTVGNEYGSTISVDGTESSKTYSIQYNCQTNEILVDISSGVEGIEIDEAAPAEYYNLQGVRIAAPEKGLYIIRQGEKVTKILK